MYKSGVLSDNFVDKALAAGFTNAGRLSGIRLECEERIRRYCNSEECPNYGKNWVCPPGCGSLEECAEKARGFDDGIVLQSVTEIDPSFKDYKKLSRAHNLRLREFVEMLGDSANVLALTNGGCILCDVCAYPKPCIKPDKRMDSLSAYGVDVGNLCEKAGLEYSFRPDRIYCIALVMIRKGTRGF